MRELERRAALRPGHLGDLVFILLRALAILIAVALGSRALWSTRPSVGASQPSPAE